MFASRGTRGPGLRAVMLVIVIAFGAGVAVGWGTGLVGEQLATEEPTSTPSPSASATAEAEVSLPPLPPIDRELDEADRAAGLNSLDVPADGPGTFITVSGEGTPRGDSGAVKWVRIEVEDGTSMSGRALSDFVLAVLDDPRGWAARGRYEFVPTMGASDIRIVIASPATAAATCPNPHVAADVGPQDEATGSSPSPSPTPAPSTSPDASDAVTVACADRGLVMISQYDWAAGLDSYGDDRTGSRVFQVNHGIGHVFGDEDGVCASGRALLMTDQRDLPEDCEPNPWPWPDEPVPSPSPEPSPTPSATAASRDIRSR